MGKIGRFWLARWLLALVMVMTLWVGSLAYTPPAQQAQALVFGKIWDVQGQVNYHGQSLLITSKITTTTSGEYTYLLHFVSSQCNSNHYFYWHAWQATAYVDYWHTAADTNGHFPVATWEWCHDGGWGNIMLTVYSPPPNSTVQGIWYSKPIYVGPVP